MPREGISTSGLKTESDLKEIPSKLEIKPGPNNQ